MSCSEQSARHRPRTLEDANPGGLFRVTPK